MRVAVIGAGLAGLSAAFFLSRKGYQVTLFDKTGIGGGASGMASGLCHPYPGRDGKLSKFATEALAETRALMAHVEEKTGQKVAHFIPFLRKHLVTFTPFPDLEETSEGVLIHSGILFSMPAYLQALFDAIPELTFRQQKISLKDNFPDYDRIIFALGGGLRKETIDLPLQYIKGQSLLVKSEEVYTQPILGNGHLLPLPDKHLLLGSTYEHHFQDDLPDLATALSSLRPRLATFLPPLDNFTILTCRAGIRVAQKGSYLPLLQKIDERKFLFTGLGSRGLLYHALYGRLLSEMV